MTALYVILALLAIIIIYIVVSYNNFIKLKNLVDEAWSAIDVFLKKRHNLIPNLIETVKGYTKHEQETLEKVINARNSAVTANSVEDKEMAENQLTKALKSVQVLFEQYPDLKASPNFLDLQNQLNEIENDISSARRYYNATVRDNNVKVKSFPSNFVANLFNFKEFPFFKLDDDEERKNIKVNFD